MNRQFKFRYWWVNDKKMESWRDMLEWDRMKVYFTDDSEFPGVLMQFTGLKDKNGKDVYEGDIVAIPDAGNYAVQWLFVGWSLYHADHVEVIGNIYENPELLKS